MPIFICVVIYVFFSLSKAFIINYYHGNFLSILRGAGWRAKFIPKIIRTKESVKRRAKMNYIK